MFPSQEIRAIPESVHGLFLDLPTNELRRVSNDKSIDVANQRTNLERYARAFEVFAGTLDFFDDRYSDELYDIRRNFLDFLSPPSALSEALLHNVNQPFRFVMLRSDEFIEFILSADPIPISKMNERQLRRILSHIRALDSDDIAKKWIQRCPRSKLTLLDDGEFTLLETIAIYILQLYYHKCRSNETESSSTFLDILDESYSLTDPRNVGAFVDVEKSSSANFYDRSYTRL